MAVPAPAIPVGNAYTVHVARPPAPDTAPDAAVAPEAAALTVFAAAAARLLAPWKVPVRMHVAGAESAAMDLRAFLAACGARASAFSPAPFPDRPGIPGEGFWKTSFAIVDGADDFWAAERPERKVEWDPLLAALTEGEPARASGPALRRADLWVVRARASGGPGDLRAEAAAWRAAGTAAVVTLGTSGAAWSSGNAVFGRSAGFAAFEPGADPRPGERHGLFAAGLVAGLVHDLLSENLFDKTMLRVERDSLAMRPLRLGRAVESGAAACLAAATETGTFELLRLPGAFAARHRDVLRARRGPDPKPWAHKGR